MSWLFGGKKKEPDEKEVDNLEQGQIWADMDVHEMSRAELRVALENRGLVSKGPKKRLKERLVRSIQEEKEDELAYLALKEAQRRSEKALEESGSIYTCGVNDSGQLGQGDKEPREEFTCILSMRAKGITQVFAGMDVAFALTEEADVYAWGGNTKGPVAMDVSKLDAVQLVKPSGDEFSTTESKAVDAYLVPMYIESLRGEGIVSVSISQMHAAAVSDGGDLYMWGVGKHGQLGLNDFEDYVTPKLVDALQDRAAIQSVGVGHSHSIGLSLTGEVYTWGHANRGKLGIGAKKREGVDPPFDSYFPVPVHVGRMGSDIKVKQIACGANHCMALTDRGVFSWGSGDGGRLGHGDTEDRLIPTPIDTFSKECVIQIAAGYWHSAAIVLVPPLADGGWVYTWGSGYHGQLGQGDVKVALRPARIEKLIQMNVVLWFISCGSHHNAVLSDENKLYTWGSNRCGCLGRDIKGAAWTPDPGFVECFDAMVDRIGRGPVASVACGQEFTILATLPYTGPTEEELLQMEHEALAEREFRKEEDERALMAQERERKRVEAEQDRIKQIQFQQTHPLCDVCEGCPGFETNVFKPNICKECGHLKSMHTNKRLEDEGDAVIGGQQVVEGEEEED